MRYALYKTMPFIPIARASETVELAATTEPAAEGILASLGLNPSLFVFQLINFVVVAAVIWYLILKPLTKKMTERQELIDKSLLDARRIEENLRLGEQKYQERIDQAKVEANKILEKTTVEAEQLSVQMKDKAKKEIEILIDQAKRNMAVDRADMLAAVKQNAADLVVMALEKILREKMDSKKDKEMIEGILSKLR